MFETMSENIKDFQYVKPWIFWEERLRGGRWSGYNYPEGDPDNVALALGHIIARI